MNHLGDTNKMVSDTPRMNAARNAAMEHMTGDVWRVGCQLERELNAANDRIKRLEAVVNDPHALWANWLRGDVKLPEGIGDVRKYQDRIKRLEEAGDRMRLYCADPDDCFAWDKAKETKP